VDQPRPSRRLAAQPAHAADAPEEAPASARPQRPRAGCGTKVCARVGLIARTDAQVVSQTAPPEGAIRHVTPDRPLALTAFSGFFAFGTLMSGISAASLAWPGSALEPMWRLKPEAREVLGSLGPWAVPLLLTVAATCAGAAVGLRKERRWGHRLAVGVLAANLVGDLLNAVVRGDRRTLVGLPIGGAMLAYLLSQRIRDRF